MSGAADEMSGTDTRPDGTGGGRPACQVKLTEIRPKNRNREIYLNPTRTLNRLVSSSLSHREGGDSGSVTEASASMDREDWFWGIEAPIVGQAAAAT
ncbi:hypothetical protein PIB30_031665 [Stylosanthes scabra]|uniref:Uncharacterized protein n=1 Tax=Stylosanthes scabra TaxID=79078 RepID=A0ABU6YAC6_9FABA|nr:hypothetical protein [Stylosanthes scabra]